MFMTDRRKERKDIAVKDAMERHQVSRRESHGKVHLTLFVWRWVDTHCGSI